MYTSLSQQPWRWRSLFHSMMGLFLVSLLLFLAACGENSSAANPVSCPATKALNGSGSTFDYPLFSQMFTQYAQTPCGVNVIYQSVGSGTGINSLLQQITDFGATDAPLTESQLKKSPNGPVLHIPVTMGVEGITYNLPALPTGTLNLTGPLLANIYLGKVLFWDDPAVQEINPTLALPHQKITVVYRSDGSGTTSIFTHYLAAVSAQWQNQVGAGTLVTWPVGIGGKGNAGVAQVIKETPGAIGYSELTYIVSNLLPYALIQNAAGRYLAPSVAGAEASAASVTAIPADLRFYIVNAPGADSYPISGFSWVIVYQHQRNGDKGEALANLLWWMIHDGQQYATPLIYGPLPSVIVTKAEGQIKSMTCGSKNVPCFIAQNNPV